MPTPIQGDRFTFAKKLSALRGLLLIAAIAVASPAHGQTVVSNLADAGAGSLRSAIVYADAHTGSTITFKAGLSGTITLASSLPSITAAMTIEGPGVAKLAVDGNASAYTAFTVAAPGLSVAISGLTAQNCSSGVDVSAGSLNMFNCAVKGCTDCGIAIDDTATITDCTISGNSSAYDGGGISVDGTGTITDCTISGNSAPYYGGGVYVANGASAGLTGCSIVNNQGGSGGGLFNFGGITTLDTCTVSGNTASSGGGLVNDLSDLTLTNCTISGNAATVNGGGLYNIRVNLNTSTTSLYDCTLSGNCAGNDGGGVWNGTSVSVLANSPTANLTVDECTIVLNTAQFGAGIYNTAVGTSSAPYGCCNANVSNSTFSGNSAGTGWGSGVYNYIKNAYSISVTIEGSILYNDYSTEIYNGGGQGTRNGSVTGCDIEGGYGGAYNINVDPMLAPLGNYGGPTQTMALLPGSPCIGLETANIDSVDQRGMPCRPGGAWDIGAFESQGFVVAVVSGNGQNTPVGTTFASPLSATVTANNSSEPVAGGALLFTAPTVGASATIGPAPINANGLASATATANNLAGNYDVIADTHAGSAKFEMTNSGTSLSKTTTALKASPNPSAFNATVTFTATVSPAVPDGETVTFLDGTTFIGVGTTSGSVATLVSSTLSVGSHSITAAYAGDSNYATSTSSSVTQIVDAVATTTTLSASPNPSIVNATVTFTAIVSPTVPDGETVTLLDGAIPIAAGTTKGSVATLALSTLSVGTHSITAQYAGDSNYLASTSGAVSQAVNPVTTALITAVTLSPAKVTGLAPATATVHLSTAAPVGGYTIIIASSNPAIANVPGPTITFPAGSTSVKFSIATASVISAQTVTISAKAGGLSKAATLTVKPPAAIVAVMPKSVAGGNSSLGIVTLSAPSTLDISVDLSSNCSAAGVPSSIVIPAGQSDAEFDVTTVPVLSNTTATITASEGGASSSAKLTVKPPTLSALSLAPTTVVGGSSASGTVSLTGITLTPVTVSISSTSNAVSFPTSTTIPAGQSQGQFSIGATAVATKTTATIKVTVAGLSKTASLMIKP
jgi:hypothetical protein